MAECRKYSCRAPAARFFSFNQGNSLTALCGPCAEGWLSDQPGFRPHEVTEDQFLDLLRVQEVMES